MYAIGNRERVSTLRAIVMTAWSSYCSVTGDHGKQDPSYTQKLFFAVFLLLLVLRGAIVNRGPMV